ncbi:hypothetical protein RRG08_050356 [Elysia crispata]|uniref:Uncharacterized protein n=1 Tax=Elysia crispata TaxID=231223 RepID=A0AAE1CLZ6_9GAST|nr:hypothetical protein RRG08_050356 [Elysia crispata]
MACKRGDIIERLSTRVLENIYKHCPSDMDTELSSNTFDLLSISKTVRLSTPTRFNILNSYSVGQSVVYLQEFKLRGSYLALLRFNIHNLQSSLIRLRNTTWHGIKTSRAGYKLRDHERCNSRITRGLVLKKDRHDSGSTAAIISALAYTEYWAFGRNGFCLAFSIVCAFEVTALTVASTQELRLYASTKR